MGAGASAVLPAECTKDDARAFAGERWNETMDQKFDAISLISTIAFSRPSLLRASGSQLLAGNSS